VAREVFQEQREPISISRKQGCFCAFLAVSQSSVCIYDNGALLATVARPFDPVLIRRCPGEHGGNVCAYSKGGASTGSTGNIRWKTVCGRCLACCGREPWSM
jgi:hypothetical protein